jgi:hypothetical protein
MKDSSRRSVRTGIDLILGVLASLAAVLAIPGFSERLQEVGLGQALTWFSLTVLALTVFFTKLKNVLEDANKIPAFLKAPASNGANPVPEVEDGDLDDYEDHRRV